MSAETALGFIKDNNGAFTPIAGQVQPVNEQIAYLNRQPAIIKEKLSKNPNIADNQSVTTARAKANDVLKKLTDKQIQGLENVIVIGGKRTKRAKTSNRKTKNKRKKPHKRN